jgi:hypothetical protein
MERLCGVADVPSPHVMCAMLLASFPEEAVHVLLLNQRNEQHRDVDVLKQLIRAKERELRPIFERLRSGGAPLSGLRALQARGAVKRPPQEHEQLPVFKKLTAPQQPGGAASGGRGCAAAGGASGAAGKEAAGGREKRAAVPGLCYHCHASPAGHIAKDCPLKGLSKEAARAQAAKVAKHKKAQ